MPRHVDVYMDGVSLASIGPILIQNVYEDAPTMELTEGERPGRYGQRILTHKRQTLKVTVEIAIRELRDLAARASIMESVASWASGSVLELSTRPERRLAVICTAFPALGTVRDYTATARIEFTAYDVPFWEDKLAAVTSLAAGSTGSGTLRIPGTVLTPVRLTVIPADTLTAFSVTVAGEVIALSGLSIPANGVLTFDRDARDDLAILYNGASQLSHRTAASADDLLASPTHAAVTYTANCSCTVTFMVKGRYA